MTIIRIPAAVNHEMSIICDKMATINRWCYLVGGAVRDIIAGKEPHDLDFISNATFDELSALFPKCFWYGAKHGIVCIQVDGKYYQIKINDNLDSALAHRDLTINTMALDCAGNLYDPVDGYRDIMVRTAKLTNGVETLREDPIRVLRYFRLVDSHNLTMDANSLDAISNSLWLFRKDDGSPTIARNKMWRETAKIINGNHETHNGLSTMFMLGVFDAIGISVNSVSCVPRVSNLQQTSVATIANMLGDYRKIKDMLVFHQLRRDEIAALKWLLQNKDKSYTPDQYTQLTTEINCLAWVHDHYLLYRPK